MWENKTQHFLKVYVKIVTKYVNKMFALQLFNELLTTIIEIFSGSF